MRPSLLGLGQESGTLDRRVPFVLGLQRRGLLLPFGGGLVGAGRRDAGLARHRGRVRRGEVGDVSGGVLDLLDLQGVNDDAQFLHLDVAAVLDLLGEPVPLPDDLLYREPADNGAQVPGEDPADQLLHPVLLGQEAPGRVRDRRRVVTDLEHGDGTHVKADPLVRDTFLDDLRLA